MSIIKKQSSSEQIVKYVLDQIKQGNFKAGDKLPNEREFAEKLGVSRVPLREAISALSMLGILEAKQGDGTFVNDFGSSELGRIIYTYTALDKTSAVELFEARRALESFAAELASRKATSEQIETIEKLAVSHHDMVDKYKNRTTDKREVFLADYALHNEIARASHNRYISKFVEAISYSFDELYNSDDVEFTYSVMSEAAKEHGRIVQAISNHEANLARQLMDTHLETVQKSVVISGT